MTQQNRFSDEELLALHKGVARQLSPECLLIDRSTCQQLIEQAKEANSLRQQVEVMEEALHNVCGEALVGGVWHQERARMVRELAQEGLEIARKIKGEG